MSLSKNVTPETLDIMYNNFVKITDWLIKGTASPMPMPPAYAELWGTIGGLATANNKITELENTIKELQRKNSDLENTLSNVNSLLEKLVSGQQQAHIKEQVTETVVARETPESAPILQDLDDIYKGETTANTTAESPNEQAIKVSAAAVDAGDIDSNSFKALDDEIAAFLPKSE